MERPYCKVPGVQNGAALLQKVPGVGKRAAAMKTPGELSCSIVHMPEHARAS